MYPGVCVTCFMCTDILLQYTVSLHVVVHWHLRHVSLALHPHIISIHLTSTTDIMVKHGEAILTVFYSSSV